MHRGQPDSRRLIITRPASSVRSSGAAGLVRSSLLQRTNIQDPENAGDHGMLRRVGGDAVQDAGADVAAGPSSRVITTAR
jgi:hypothetical protein